MDDLDALLPRGVHRESGPAVAPPSDVEEGYVLPAHSVKPLARMSAHALDELLVFYEEPHVYTFRGVPTSQSVTGVAHEFEKPFVPMDAIASMKVSRSQTWPRLEYVVDARAGLASWTTGRGALVVCAGKTVATMMPHGVESSTATREGVAALLHAMRLRDGPTGEDEMYTFERAMSDEEIAASWTRKGMIASHEGTEAHWLCECFLNGIPCRWWERELDVFFDFARTHLIPRGIVAWATEREIVCEDADLAGSVDAIFYEPSTDMYHIVDFKRSDKLRGQMRGFGRMQGALSHLDDCKGASYALQLGIYQYILEREYGLSIGDRILLSIHPDRPFCTSVPYLREEVSFLMERRFALVRARRRAAEENAMLKCAITGAPAVDAVRLADDDRVVMHKVAQVKELPIAGPAQDVRDALERAVEAHLEETTLSRCVLWRKRMPEEGLVPFS